MPLARKALADKVVQAARAVAGNDLGAEAAQAEVEERSSVAAVAVAVLLAVAQVAAPAAEANSVAEAADVFFASK